MNYVWLGNNEQIDDSQIININNQINDNIFIDGLSIGGFFNLLFGVNVTYDVERVWD